jgi:hypothetical protein
LYGLAALQRGCLRFVALAAGNDFAIARFEPEPKLARMSWKTSNLPAMRASPASRVDDFAL